MVYRQLVDLLKMTIFNNFNPKFMALVKIVSLKVAIHNKPNRFSVFAKRILISFFLLRAKPCFTDLVIFI